MCFFFQMSMKTRAKKINYKKLAGLDNNDDENDRKSKPNETIQISSGDEMTYNFSKTKIKKELLSDSTQDSDIPLSKLMKTKKRMNKSQAGSQTQMV